MTPADTPHTAASSYRGWLAVVLLLGALILLGLGAIAGGLLLGGGPGRATAREPYLAMLPAAPGARIAAAEIDGARLLVRIDDGGAGSLVVLEAGTGRVIGRVALEPVP